MKKKECGSVVSQKLGWKKFVKIVRNKPIMKKIVENNSLKKKWKKLA